MSKQHVHIEQIETAWRLSNSTVHRRMPSIFPSHEISRRPLTYEKAAKPFLTG